MVASASCEGFDRALPSVMTVRVWGKEKGGRVTQESRAIMWCLKAMVFFFWFRAAILEGLVRCGW